MQVRVKVGLWRATPGWARLVDRLRRLRASQWRSGGCGGERLGGRGAGGKFGVVARQGVGALATTAKGDRCGSSSPAATLSQCPWRWLGGWGTGWGVSRPAVPVGAWGRLRSTSRGLGLATMFSTGDGTGGHGEGGGGTPGAVRHVPAPPKTKFGWLSFNAEEGSRAPPTPPSTIRPGTETTCPASKEVATPYPPALAPLLPWAGAPAGVRARQPRRRAPRARFEAAIGARRGVSST
jgi:hypothetical protein